MATAVDTIKTLMNTLRNYSTDDSYVGVTALDNAIRTSTFFANTEEAIYRLNGALSDTETYPDTDTRLQKFTGMVLGAENDYTADTGAITGSNAGGSTVKNAQDIVPESGDLSTATLPTPGSTVPITYTGNDGKSFTFYVKYPESFSTVVHGFHKEDGVDYETRLTDRRYHVDLNTVDANYNYSITYTDTDGVEQTLTSASVAQMKESIPTIVKALNTYWLRESAKLNYDSIGLALDGQTIEFKFVTGDLYDGLSAITFPRRNDSQPSNNIIIAVNLFNYGNISPTDPNGNTNYNGGKEGLYLDRVIAHEMVHAVMFATGTLKKGMPQFFTEGIADLVQGDDDYNSEQRKNMIKLVNEPDILKEALILTPGTGSNYAYPAGDMFLRYLAQQSLNITPMIGDSTQQQTFSYSTRDGVISGYKEGDVINYNLTDGAALRYAGLGGVNDLILTEFTANFEDEKTLVIRDVRGKFITLNRNNATAYAYMAKSSTELDGNNFSNGNNYEILFGTNYENDILRAGNGGSQLWGGLSGNDELFGGAGEDNFMYDFGGGNDNIYNAESQDQVTIFNLSLDQISSAQINDNGVNLQFTDGGSLNISGQAGNFVVEKNNNYYFYTADYQNKTWSQK